MINPIFSSVYYFPFLILTFLFAFLSFNPLKRINIKINRNDIVIFSFITFLCIRKIYFSPYPISFSDFYLPILYFLIYFLSKVLYDNKTFTQKYIFYFLAIIALFEIIIGYSQYFGWQSNNIFFKVTGSFNTPAIFTNYLCLNIPILLSLYQITINKIVRKCFLLIICLIIGLCFLTDSKLSWLIIVIFSFLLFLFKKNWTTKAIRMYALIGLAILLSIVAILIYKQDSTSGRFFVWTNCYHLFLDNPLWGIGSGMFERYYNYEQAKFLFENPDSKYLLLSSYITTPYSEYILFILEGGIIAITLIIALSIYTYKSKLLTFNRCELQGAIYMFLFMALFSFPFQSSSTCSLFFIFLGFLSAKSKPIILASFRSLYICISLLLLYIPLSTLVFNIYNSISKWNYIVNNYHHMDVKEIEKNYYEISTPIKNIDDFKIDFAGLFYTVGKYENTISILEELSQSSSRGDIFMMLGQCYEQNKNNIKAEQYYRKGCYLLPNLLRPKFILMQFYISNNRITEAKKEAEQIVLTPIKIENQDSKDIVRYAKEFLND